MGHLHSLSFLLPLLLLLLLTLQPVESKAVKRNVYSPIYIKQNVKIGHKRQRRSRSRRRRSVSSTTMAPTKQEPLTEVVQDDVLQDLPNDDIPSSLGSDFDFASGGDSLNGVQSIDNALALPDSDPVSSEDSLSNRMPQQKIAMPHVVHHKTRNFDVEGPPAVKLPPSSQGDLPPLESGEPFDSEDSIQSAESMGGVMSYGPAFDPPRRQYGNNVYMVHDAGLRQGLERPDSSIESLDSDSGIESDMDEDVGIISSSDDSSLQGELDKEAFLGKKEQRQTPKTSIMGVGALGAVASAIIISALVFTANDREEDATRPNRRGIHVVDDSEQDDDSSDDDEEEDDESEVESEDGKHARRVALVGRRDYIGLKA